MNNSFQNDAKRCESHVLLVLHSKVFRFVKIAFFTKSKSSKCETNDKEEIKLYSANRILNTILNSFLFYSHLFFFCVQMTRVQVQSMAI